MFGLVITTKKRLDEKESSAITKDYRLGWIMGQVEARNRAWLGQLADEPQSFVDKQVEVILQKDTERNGEL